MSGPAPAAGRCEHGVAYNGRLCRKCHPMWVSVPPDLARDILAALEAEALGHIRVHPDHLRALAARLRERTRE